MLTPLSPSLQGKHIYIWPCMQQLVKRSFAESFYFARMMCFYLGCDSRIWIWKYEKSSWVRSGPDIHEDYIHNVFYWLRPPPVLLIIMSVGSVCVCRVADYSDAHMCPPILFSLKPITHTVLQGMNHYLDGFSSYMCQQDG